MTEPTTGPTTRPPWRPVLSRAAMLRHDPVRQADLLIVPERIVVLNEEAAAIVGLCDGERTVADIVAELPEGVAADVVEFLDRVRAEGWLR
ncbi:pyrroloquinoline quinone biosynthesis peptide chaperone PqqD [Nonomuraea sp. NPDC050680]|jgi:pyrroloquinoline quinone biosynthesis protein D|uniref:pyrroloquinoline quinone biosynthesis peptide chaperone PqqD n=1 Tax=Nonomuraea sp. NPDC050680 TaxID=3154630 RepID=UPI0033DE026B